jgi:hypothetical protein
MPYVIKYYDDLDLGFLYQEVAGREDQPVATFYPDRRTGTGWRFIVPPSEVGRVFPDHDMHIAVTSFLESIGVKNSEIRMENS